MNKSEAVNY